MNRCWCGRPALSGRCDQDHDPYDIYLCSCGLHLFTTEQSASPGAWARHRAHIAEFQVRMQARIDAAIVLAGGVDSALGPCACCRKQCVRYGPSGSPLCPACAGVPASALEALAEGGLL
jgi:hypothetical protein